jgi:hypothetical protein
MLRTRRVFEGDVRNINVEHIADGETPKWAGVDLNYSGVATPKFCYCSISCMADARIEEVKMLLPQCLTPDWVRLGRRLARLLRDRH